MARLAVAPALALAPALATLLAVTLRPPTAGADLPGTPVFHPNITTPAGPAKPQGPMLVVIPAEQGEQCGTVLAFSDGCPPAAAPCVLLRRSTTCGLSFGPVILIQGGAGGQPVWDAARGAVVFLFSRADPTLAPQNTSCDGGTVHNVLLAIHSHNRGLDWTAPGQAVNVTTVLEQQAGLAQSKAICLDPVTGAGAQLVSVGQHKGRLLWTATHNVDLGVAVVRSDDGGQSNFSVSTSLLRPGPDESWLTELPNSSVIIFMRHCDKSAGFSSRAGGISPCLKVASNRRIDYALSSDGEPSRPCRKHFQGLRCSRRRRELWADPHPPRHHVRCVRGLGDERLRKVVVQPFRWSLRGHGQDRRDECAGVHDGAAQRRQRRALPPAAAAHQHHGVRGLQLRRVWPGASRRRAARLRRALQRRADRRAVRRAARGHAHALPLGPCEVSGLLLFAGLNRFGASRARITLPSAQRRGWGMLTRLFRHARHGLARFGAGSPRGLTRLRRTR